MTNLSQIGQYRIEIHLGTGEWTETFHAYDVVLRRPVALQKLLRPGILPAWVNYRDFLSAAQLASELVHPRIAWVWSTGELENQFFIVERFIGGDSLARQLSQNGPLPWDKALRTIEQVAQAIEFAEERQWIHGRVTPHNILLSSDHGAVLSDYGLEKAIHQFLPLTEVPLYDAQYLAPEILSNRPATARADQYSLACTLVEMLAGKNPFQAPSPEESLVLKTTGVVRSLLPLDIMPIQVVDIIERALHADPSVRYANSLDFVSAVDRAIRTEVNEAVARQQHEETLRRWREDEEASQRQAEETERLAALDQARKELHERAHFEAEQAINSQTSGSINNEMRNESPPTDDTPSTLIQSDHDKQDISPEYSRPVREHRSSRKRSNRWLFTIGFLIILLGAGSYWMINRQVTTVKPTASPTFTLSLQPALQDTSIYSIPGLTPTRLNTTATSTIHPSPTRSLTPTSSLTPSQTRSPSPTDTPLPPSSTPTQVRPEKEDRSQSE